MIPARRYIVEFLGTAALLAIVVGSGIMGERLAAGNAAVALLANSLATGAGLFVLIVTFAPVSGAHFNPVVTLQGVLLGNHKIRSAFACIVLQCCGAVCGVVLAHGMFGREAFEHSHHLRNTPGEFLGEIVATAGLLLVIRGNGKAPLPLAAALLACYITAAYWFTSSTCFANPAVTIARSLTDSFSGIAPESVGRFIAGQGLGLALAWVGGLALFGRD